LDLDLLGTCREIIESFCREMHLCVPPHHPVYNRPIGVFLVINHKVDKARSDAQGAAKSAMPRIPLSCMLEHEVRQGRPGIADFLFQKAENPQPRAVPSAFVLKIISVGPPAGLHGIELNPRPWQGRRFRIWNFWRPVGVADAPRDPPRQERSRPLQDSPTRNQPPAFFLSFHTFLLW